MGVLSVETMNAIAAEIFGPGVTYDVETDRLRSAPQPEPMAITVRPPQFERRPLSTWFRRACRRSRRRSCNRPGSGDPAGQSKGWWRKTEDDEGGGCGVGVMVGLRDGCDQASLNRG